MRITHPKKMDGDAVVLIIGSGFGGLNAAKKLANKPGVHVLLIDQKNHHLFQPLLYQVATAGLSPADIAAPIRSVLRRQRNTEVLLAEVTGITADEVLLADGRRIRYDYLIVATHDDCERHDTHNATSRSNQPFST